jgi:hypothetical protein
MTDPARQLLADAANYIVEHGWTQKHMRDACGAVCALGAIHHVPVTTRDPADVTAISHLRFIAEMMLSEHPAVQGDVSIAHWNDHPDRTAEDVILTFREAANHDT